jgi:hypothetical protein
VKEAIQYLTDEQLAFIEKEFGFNEQALLAMDEDSLYDKVYDECCAIEEIETVAADDSHADLSKRGELAADIVTILGNTLWEESTFIMDSISLAKEIATRAHSGQKDRGGSDYILHPLAVADMVEGEDEKVVALLHDVLEDTEFSESSIRVLFGDTITDAVVAMTKQPGEAYEDFILRAKQNPIARKVKLADLHHNSDLSRLKEVTQKDLARLDKYKAAITVLESD